MATRITVNLNSVATILADRKLEKGGQAQRFMTSEVKRLSDPYTPLDTSTLKSNVTMQADSITYNSPYANYQWKGISKNGRSLRYHGEPMRGRAWVNRAMADRKSDVVKAVAAFVGGKAE